MEQQIERQTRGAVAYFPTSIFQELLDLPPGVRVRGIYLDAASACIVLHLEGDALPVVTPGTIPERAWISIETGPTPDSGQQVRRIRVDLPTEGEH